MDHFWNEVPRLAYGFSQSLWRWSSSNDDELLIEGQKKKKKPRFNYFCTRISSKQLEWWSFILGNKFMWSLPTVLAYVMFGSFVVCFESQQKEGRKPVIPVKSRKTLFNPKIQMQPLDNNMEIKVLIYCWHTILVALSEE